MAVATRLPAAMLMYLDEERVRSLLRWSELIPAMETALAELARGHVIQPLRSKLAVESDRRYLLVMPAIARDMMGVKVVSLYPCNAETGIPTVTGLIVLLRADTGEPLAVMDGRLITEMRTAAVSAAVTNRLTAPESSTLALLGSGVQARAHLAALKHVRRFRDIRVWSRDPAHAERFGREHGATPMDIESAVRGADVVVTATNATQPVLKGAWLKPGAHVNAVGAPLPSWRELDDAAMANTLVVDSREAVCRESGDVILSNAVIYAEAGEIFAGLKSVPAAATTVFKSVGLAIEDIAAASLVYEAALQQPIVQDGSLRGG